MIGEVARGFVNQLRNTYKFFADYAERVDTGAVAPRRPIARWWTAGCSAGSTRPSPRFMRAWSAYDPTPGVRILMAFVDELSNWYVRVNRPRFWAVDAAADPAALATLHEALVSVSRMLAPAAPS